MGLSKQKIISTKVKNKIVKTFSNFAQRLHAEDCEEGGGGPIPFFDPHKMLCKINH